MNWFATDRVIVMESPSQSPDLNLIEHLWEELEKRVSGIRARSADEKFSQLQTAWAQIPHPVDPVDAKKISSCYRFSRALHQAVFSVLTYRSILMYIDSNFLISHQSDIFASGPNFYYCTT
uniref:Tc1-like transposase DDE domain-containing protein n=2 Tax=Caenorhabditis japonica TaxID=281687 RepID=A0A8R1E664_CAEJA